MGIINFYRLKNSLCVPILRQLLQLLTRLGRWREQQFVHFDVVEICGLLSTRQLDCPIISNANMITGSLHRYNYLPSKHAKWLQMVKDEFIGEGVVIRF